MRPIYSSARFVGFVKRVTQKDSLNQQHCTYELDTCKQFVESHGHRYGLQLAVVLLVGLPTENEAKMKHEVGVVSLSFLSASSVSFIALRFEAVEQ